MRANELLFWLSARVQGSWEQFKTAVESLHMPDDQPSGEEATKEDSRQSGLPLHQELRLMLERLGHVEFFTAGCEGGWRIASPIWAESEANHPTSAVLCGARTLPLLERVHCGIADPVSLHVDEVVGSPTIYFLTSPTRDGLMSAAAATGIRVQYDAPRALLGAQTSVLDQYEEIVDFPLGRDWVVDSFDTQTLRWKLSSREEGHTTHDGLFRFRLSYQRRHFLRRRGRSYEMAGAAAKYALLRRRRRNVFQHVAALNACIVPASCRPPLLVERALILCSGRPPVFDAENTTLIYGSVSADIASLAARLLDQELLP